MDPVFAWLFLILFWGLPLVHVVTSPRSGPWRPPEGSRCPFGPRAGWVVMVAMLGAIGWLMFMKARYRRGAEQNERIAE